MCRWCAASVLLASALTPRCLSATVLHVLGPYLVNMRRGNTRMRGGGPYGFGMQGTRRAAGDPSLLRGRRGSGALKQAKAGESTLAKCYCKSRRGVKASISEHPKPPLPPTSVRPFDGHRVGRQSTLHAPTAEILSQT